MQLTTYQMDLSKQNKFFTFMLENKLHGIKKNDIEAFLPHGNLFQLSKCPHDIKGFLIHGKYFIPVVDVKIKLNLPETILTRNTKIVIVKCTLNQINFKVGILIDKAIDSQDIEPGMKEIKILNINSLINENDYITYTTILNNNLKKIRQKSFTTENITFCD